MGKGGYVTNSLRCGEQGDGRGEMWNVDMAMNGVGFYM